MTLHFFSSRSPLWKYVVESILRYHANRAHNYQVEKKTLQSLHFATRDIRQSLHSFALIYERCDFHENLLESPSHRL